MYIIEADILEEKGTQLSYKNRIEIVIDIVQEIFLWIYHPKFHKNRLKDSNCKVQFW